MRFITKPSATEISKGREKVSAWSHRIHFHRRLRPDAPQPEAQTRCTPEHGSLKLLLFSVSLYFWPGSFHLGRKEHTARLAPQGAAEREETGQERVQSGSRCSPSTAGPQAL